MTTRQHLNRLLDEGDIGASQEKAFYAVVRSFYITAVKYSLDNLPLNDPVLKNALFVDFAQREQAAFPQVEFFIHRYCCMHDCTN